MLPTWGVSLIVAKAFSLSSNYLLVDWILVLLYFFIFMTLHFSCNKVLYCLVLMDCHKKCNLLFMFWITETCCDCTGLAKTIESSIQCCYNLIEVDKTLKQ